MQAIELRVHGVSGTSPEALLDRPAVDEVAGDKIAGFYRPRFEDERTDTAPNPFAVRQPRAPEMEAYNWGGLTSGSPGRALWLLLLPFTLINIAPRARPNDTGDGAKARTWLTWYLSRAVALLLTLLFVLAGIGAGEDLVGWQCRRGNYCAESLPKFFLDWLKHPGSDPEIASNLGPLFVSAFIPGVMLFILWFVSGRTLNKYEDIRVHGQGGKAERDGVDALETPLSSPWMWRNQDQVRRLRAIHIQCGIAMILWTLMQPIQKPWGSSDTILDELSSHLWSLAPAAVLVYGFVVLGRRTYVGHGEGRVWRKLSAVIWVVLLALTIGIGWIQLRDGAVNSAWVENRGRPTASLPTQLPGFDETLLVVLVLTTILLTLLLAVVWVSASNQDSKATEGSDQTELSPGLTGRAAVALSILAVLLGAAFSAAIYSYAATWLYSGSLRPSLGQVSDALTDFVPPSAFRVATMAIVFSVGTAVVIFVVAGVRTVIGIGPGGWGKVAGVPPHALDRDYESELALPGRDKGREKQRRRSIERAVFVATFVERIPVVAAWLVGVGAVITLGFGLLLVPSELKPDGKAADLLYRPDSLHMPAIWEWLVSPDGQAWGAYFTVLGLLGLVTIAAAAFRVPATRRVVGIVWDVASFWPRSCHPLAAPCYAERTVPDLVTRVHYHCEKKDRPVVLAAHSQGTVLSAAVLAQLEGDPRMAADLEKVSLLTFGCVLRRLYARYFPVYFGLAFLTHLQELLTRKGHADPRWINLWRYTDYLGGQVTDGPPQQVPRTASAPVNRGALPQAPPVALPTTWEWHSPDPPLFDVPPGSTTYLKPRRHSDFWKDDSGIFQLAVVRLASHHEPDDPDVPADP